MTLGQSNLKASLLLQLFSLGTVYCLFFHTYTNIRKLISRALLINYTHTKHLMNQLLDPVSIKVLTWLFQWINFLILRHLGHIWHLKFSEVSASFLFISFRQSFLLRILNCTFELRVELQKLCIFTPES